MPSSESPTDSDLTQYRAFHQGIFEVARGSIDRARAGAESVRNAAAAIGVIYAAIVGVAFSWTRRFRRVGSFPQSSWGLAIAEGPATWRFSRRRWTRFRGRSKAETYRSDQVARSGSSLNGFRRVSIGGAARVASVLALAFAVAFLPAPFLKLEASAISDDASSELPAWPPSAEGQ